jgi:SAM-dependent methyltransferase
MDQGAFMPSPDFVADQPAFPPELNLGVARDILSAGAAAVAGNVNLRLSADDGMYHPGGDVHYLTCGASALNVVLAAGQLASAPAPSSVLDFGAGAGRVTRWLRAAFPNAHLAACDLRPQDMEFCRLQFGAEGWVSGIDIGALQAPATYDLIWVGSVLTHLSAENSARLIDKLLSWTNPRGLLIMSMIGRTAKKRKDDGGDDYIHAEGWAEVVREYSTLGYGYADYAGERGYGLSLSKLSWTGALVERLPGTRLIALSEAVWDDLHDIVAIQKIEGSDGMRPNAVEVAAALRDEAVAARRGAAIEASTLWRATGPIRSAARFFGR